VILVGFMGAGKTSVGRELAERLGCSFADLDEHIQAREQRSIEEIFRDSGETGFRHAEHAALRALLQESNAGERVLALGGGAFVQSRNADLLRQAAARTVFLDAPVEELFRRCQEQNLERPLRRDLEQFRKLYQERRASYGTAQFRIDTRDKRVSQVADDVIAALGLTLHSRKEQ
jgi:shikimate kinase